MTLTLTPAEQLLCLLNLAELSPGGEAKARALAQQIADWGVFYQLAHLNRVVPLTYKRLKSLGLSNLLGEEIEALCQAHTALIGERNAARAAWVKQCLTLMAEAGIEVIGLKGIVFADALYGDPAYKRMNDADLLLRFAEVERAREIFANLGFDSVTGLFSKDEYSLDTHHSPPQISPDAGAVFGLHWGLTSPQGPYRADLEGIWRRKQPALIAGAPGFRMSWEDNLLHLCVHLPFFKTGLRELADVYNVVLAARPFDWQAFAAHVSEAHAEEPAYRVLSLANAMMPIGVPSPLLSQWAERASPFARNDTALRLSTPGLLLRSRSVHLGEIEKAYIVLHTSDAFAERREHWLKTLSLWLWPSDAETQRISGELDWTSWRARARARLVTPAKIWTALARDHGHSTMALMTALNALAVARAAVKTKLRGDGPSFSEHPYARVLSAME